MLRSLFAVLVSVILGLSIAKFIEGGGISLMGEERGLSYSLLLLFSWFVSAFIASALAICIGRGWAPLGLLSALTIFFSAFMTLLSASLSWAMWPGAAVAAIVGGYLALRVTKARSEFPVMSSKDEYFSGD